PEEQDGEKQPRVVVQAGTRRRPSDERGNRARDGADQRAEGRTSLEGSVEEEVARERRQREQRWHGPDREQELADSREGEKRAEHQRVRRRNAAAGDRSAGGPAHARIDTALHPLVESRRS